MKKILLTILAVLAMSGMAMAQTAPSDINLHRNEDGSWSFIMPGRNLVMSTETFSTNDTVNGHYLGGVPEGWLILALGDTVPVSNDSLRRTTPITEGTPVTIVPTGNLRRIKSITLVDVLPPAPATRTLAEATAEDIGKVVCAAGHLHDAKTAVPDGCTAVGILGKVTATGHGLILALQDATQQSWNTINGWTSVTTYAGTTLKQLPDDAARGSLTSYTTLGSTTVSNWCVAQKSDYEAIFTNLGSTAVSSGNTSFDANVNAYITTDDVGTAMSGYYWSASEYEGGQWGWTFWDPYWNSGNKSSAKSLRPVLGF